MTDEPRSVSVRDIVFRRDGRTILDAVSLTAPVGAVTALVGPSGSGKSTLLAILAGLERPDSGTVDNPIPSGETALVLQAYGLATLLTAAENVEIALQSRPGLSRHTIRTRAATALAEVGLDEVAEHLTETLSGGQQQRVAIARALVLRPRLLIADEFTAELDHRTREHVTRLVRAVADGGGTVVLATHDDDVAASAEHVVDLAQLAAATEH